MFRLHHPVSNSFSLTIMSNYVLCCFVFLNKRYPTYIAIDFIWSHIHSCHFLQSISSQFMVNNSNRAFTKFSKNLKYHIVSKVKLYGHNQT